MTEERREELKYAQRYFLSRFWLLLVMALPMAATAFGIAKEAGHLWIAYAFWALLACGVLYPLQFYISAGIMLRYGIDPVREK